MTNHGLALHVRLQEKSITVPLISLISQNHIKLKAS